MFFIFYANILDDRQKASQSWGSIGSRVVEEYRRLVGGEKEGSKGVLEGSRGIKEGSRVAYESSRGV